MTNKSKLYPNGNIVEVYVKIIPHRAEWTNEQPPSYL